MAWVEDKKDRIINKEFIAIMIYIVLSVGLVVSLFLLVCSFIDKDPTTNKTLFKPEFIAYAISSFIGTCISVCVFVFFVCHIEEMQKINKHLTEITNTNKIPKDNS